MYWSFDSLQANAVPKLILKCPDFYFYFFICEAICGQSLEQNIQHVLLGYNSEIASRVTKLVQLITPFPIPLAPLRHVCSYRSHAAIQWLKTDEACSKVYTIEHSINAPSSKFLLSTPFPATRTEPSIRSRKSTPDTGWWSGDSGANDKWISQIRPQYTMTICWEHMTFSKILIHCAMQN